MKSVKYKSDYKLRNQHKLRRNRSKVGDMIFQNEKADLLRSITDEGNPVATFLVNNNNQMFNNSLVEDLYWFPS